MGYLSRALRIEGGLQVDIPTVETQRITAKIDAIKKERDQTVISANQQIAYLSGQIAALEALLKPEQPSGDAKGE